MNKLKFLGIIGGLALIGAAFAQETPGVATNTSGAIIKGKAPVAKDLLRVKFPSPKSFKLPNGLTVYLLEDHRVPAVRFSLQLRAGSIYESKPGVANATASMLTEGTASRTNNQISETVEGMGSNLNANAGLDMATISASGLSENADALLGLMADVLQHPSFPTDRMDRFRTGQRAGLSQRRSNPAGMIAELQSKLFYGGTKYARTTPSREELQAITVDDLKTFRDTYYRPNGAILGVTGDIDVKTLEEKVKMAFDGWTASGDTAMLPAADFQPQAAPHIYLIDRPNSAQSSLQFGSLGVKENDPDYIALVVANRILGGGSAGRLFQNIRERKGYTYGAYSSLSGGRWPGIWGANANVRTEVTEPAVGEFFYEFKRIQDEPVSAQELADAKRSIIGGFARTLESSDGLLARSLELVQNDLPADYWDTYPAKIEAVTADDVQRVAKKYLGSNIQLLVVGERSKIETGLNKYGKVQLVDGTKLVIPSN